MTAILEACGVGRTFGRGSRATVALDDVSFQLDAGKTLGVVGSSGSGKSTLGEVAGGLQRPTSGSIRFEGADVARLGRAARAGYRRAVQFIFQDPQASMDPLYRVQDVLVEPLATLEPHLSRPERVMRASAMLEQVGLDADALRARPRELSGGQCQRVAIARALITRPRVVVCDECTSALDVSVRAQTLNLLRDLQDELGIAYLFISHSMEVVAYMADDVLVMHRGRVVEYGPIERVMGAPKDEHTRALLDCARDRGAFR